MSRETTGSAWSVFESGPAFGTFSFVQELPPHHSLCCNTCPRTLSLRMHADYSSLIIQVLVYTYIYHVRSLVNMYMYKHHYSSLLQQKSV